ncbi:hypothetical protein V2J09_004547 [Rumex salicifolius]
MTTAMKKNFMPPNLVSNLQEVLRKKKGADSDDPPSSAAPAATGSNPDEDCKKPIVLVTNGDGFDSPGLSLLVEALVHEKLYNVNVIAPQSDKSLSGHSVTLNETVAVSSLDISGATAYEVSGTPVDCVSLAFSGALFSWSKPLVWDQSWIELRSSHILLWYCSWSTRSLDQWCTIHFDINELVIESLLLTFFVMILLFVIEYFLSYPFYRKADSSQESNFNEAVALCIPIINAAIRDIEKGEFPKSCSLNIEIPTSPSSNKGFRVTKQSSWRSSPSWRTISSQRNPSGNFMSNQQSLGMQLAQLSRDASAAGAARRLNTHKKNVEIESVGVAGKSGYERVKKYFRQEFHPKDMEDIDEDLDVIALENGFVAVTPVYLSSQSGSETPTAVKQWLNTVVKESGRSQAQPTSTIPEGEKWKKMRNKKENI